MRNYGYHLKKNAELWAPFWKNVAKCLFFIEHALCRVELCAWFSSCLRNYGSYVCQTWLRLQILNQNDTPPPKLGLVTPPPRGRIEHESFHKNGSQGNSYEKSITPVVACRGLTRNTKLELIYEVMHFRSICANIITTWLSL